MQLTWMEIGNVGRRWQRSTGTNWVEQVMGSQKCQDGADVFDVAGMHRAGKKVVGLAWLERAVSLRAYRA